MTASKDTSLFDDDPTDLFVSDSDLDNPNAGLLGYSFAEKRISVVSRKGFLDNQEEEDLKERGSGYSRRDLFRYKDLCKPKLLKGKCDTEYLVRELNKEFPWMISWIRSIARSMALHSLRMGNFVSFPPMLLVGDPGIGKTRYVRRLSDLLGLSFRRFDCAGVTETYRFTGSPAEYRGSRCSFITDLIIDGDTANPIIFMDEIDKIGSSDHNGKLDDALLNALEPESAARFEDRYYDCDLDLTHVSWILAANDVSKISEALLSRVQVIHLGRPRAEHLEAVLSGIIADIEKQHNLEAGSLDQIAERDMHRWREALAGHGSLRYLRREIVDHYAGRVFASIDIRWPTLPETSDLWRRCVHEAGHIAAEIFGPCSYGIVSASIEPSSEQGSLGQVVRSAGTRDYTREDMLADIVFSLGGRAAEEIVFGVDNVSAGAVKDIKLARDMARRIVVDFGMSVRGVIASSESEKAKERVENEVEGILKFAMSEARVIVATRKSFLMKTANMLMEKKTLNCTDISAIARPHLKKYHPRAMMDRAVGAFQRIADIAPSTKKRSR